MAGYTFRNPRIRKLADMAVSQGFEVRKAGSGHYAFKCPRCGEETILSGTESDKSRYKYRNQEAMFRRHCLKIPGKKSRKECVSNAVHNIRG